MNRIFLFALIAVLGLPLGACQKRPTDAERNAEIERQVRERLAAEHQTEEQQQLAQRKAELDAREQALAEKESRPEETSTPAPTAAATPRPAVAADAGSETGSYATFYRKLDPYGDWMETGDYGYVFQPRQAAQSHDWRPYTNGHWVYTDAGWTWISDEQFGWATYHYGRWVRLRSVGWVWVPGEQWAPAWVSWRKGNDYVGWAPLPPEAQFDRQTGIRNWADNYYDIGPEQYAFVPAKQFGAKVSAQVVVPSVRNVTIINQTTNVTNITYNNSVIVDRGPSYDDLRARSSQPIERFRLERTLDANNERPVFRGEVVALPTVDFRPTGRATRPVRVSRTIAQPAVERGWEGIRDPQAARKARDKMKAEATPPPDAPPKRFVRPEQRTEIPPERAVTNISTPVATATPVSTPIETPANPERPRHPDAKPRPTVAPPVATATPPKVIPAPSVKPPPPIPLEKVSSPKPADRNRPQEAAAVREAKRQARQQARAESRAAQEKAMEEGRAKKTGRALPSPARPVPAATPVPRASAATPSPTVPAPTASSPTPAFSKKQQAAQQRREKRAAMRERQSQARPEISPLPSPSPEAQQP